MRKGSLMIRRLLPFAAVALLMMAIAGGTVAALSLGAPSSGPAATPGVSPVPAQLNFQGRLNNAQGQPVADGIHQLTFRIYDVPVDGTPLWDETHSVATNNGLFSVLLGSTAGNPLTPELFSGGGDRWLGIQVDADPEMEPRQPIASVPFALVAQQAESLGGVLTGGQLVAQFADLQAIIADLEARLSGVEPPCVGDADCNDGNSCTVDACDVDRGRCVFNPGASSAACGDPATGACTAADTCDVRGVCQPNNLQPGTGCDDLEQCTQADACDASGQCVGTPLADGTACDDGNPNTAADVCQSGVCVGGCSAGQELCSGSCTDTATDPNNCGMCGTACGANQACGSGVCSCASGFANCDANAANGCEANLSDDVNNCGGCGIVCGSGQACQAGACVAAAVEVCNGIDDDGDGLIDNITPTACGTSVGVCSAGITACTNGSIVCNGEISPSSEVCDGLDNDCDGQIDDGFPFLGTVCSVGVGVCETAGVRVCSADGLGLECSATPGIPDVEVCDGLDNDCDGEVDELVTTTFFRDLDGDTFGDPSVTVHACTAPPGFVSDGNDCDDTNLNANPGTVEVCDGVDNDCDGVVDQGGVCS